MATRPSSASSTELPHAIAFERFADSLVPSLAPRLGVAANKRAVSKALADDAAIAARLLRLPAAALAILERVVESDGELGEDALFWVAEAQLGLTKAQAQSALAVLAQDGLIVSTIHTSFVGDKHRAIQILDVCARAIARRVRGLTIPIVPADPPEEPQHGHACRDLVALLAGVAHVPIRFTQYGDANRGSVKKLAGIVGWSEARVTTAIDAAINAGVLAGKGTVLAPMVTQLAALARGEIVCLADPWLRTIADWVPRDTWIAREALFRAIVAVELSDFRHSQPREAYINTAHLYDRAAQTIERLELEHRSVDGVELVRRASPRRTGHGDGHVTPSFEVMLGPAADTFVHAAARGSEVWLRLSSKTKGERVLALRPERVLERGTDVALLGTDPETEQSRSFPLANVLSVMPRAAAAPSVL